MAQYNQYKAKSANTSSGVEDMVLLSKVDEDSIVENLRKRYMEDLIYTYIGPVLIAVNPFKQLPYFTPREIEQYQGTAAHENPPHIYALADSMFRDMVIDEENQCVIISGESGAGKTESAKLVMNYISAVSGRGGDAVEHIKRIILESNPLLESFGNAKTLRNNNSSRFGKYFEIRFSRQGGMPSGGNVLNFLLEKSRVVSQKQGERNFHVFYQITKGASRQEQESFGMTSPEYFWYLNQSQTYDADGIDDVEEYAACKNAMSVCEISPQDAQTIWQIVAGILHLGNIQFTEAKVNEAAVADPSTLEFPGYLLGINAADLNGKLISRQMSTGSGPGRRGTIYDVPLNPTQAAQTRDALAKALYSRVFDWLVLAVNRAISKMKDDRALCLGVLDIYGFEIFQKNYFEQLCINYVNEKLQQIFIELTLKSEQEEYVREGIQWTPIEFFNNKIVVDLIEGKKPVGILPILDDVCATMHAVTEGSDVKFVQKLDQIQNAHYNGGGSQFTVKHYAGNVTYDCDGFCESNKDALYKDLIILMQGTNNPFIRNLFPEDTTQDDKKRPTTAGFKIRTQANDLVTTLMKCVPHYIRCIKPNETKRSRDWDAKRVEFQVRYLNLKENIRIRRAGFAYRQAFDKFNKRFAILTRETFPSYRGDAKQGVQILCQAAELDRNQWQLGKSKVFIKSPESLFLLEELRERKYHGYARTIQRCYRRWKSRKYFLELKAKSVNILRNQKERKRLTLNAEFRGDYLNTLDNPTLRSLVGGRQVKIEFSSEIVKYDRSMKAQTREILLSQDTLFFTGVEKINEGPKKGQFVKIIKRKLALNQISGASVSTLSDDFVVLHVNGDFDNVFECFFKTELLTVLSDKMEKLNGRPLNVNFSDVIQYTVGKKSTFAGSGTKKLTFTSDRSRNGSLAKSNGTVLVGPGLPRDSQPTIQQYKPSSYQRSAAPKSKGPSGGGGGGGYGNGAPAGGGGGGGGYGNNNPYGGAPNGGGYGGAPPQQQQQSFRPQAAAQGYGGPRGPGGPGQGAPMGMGRPQQQQQPQQQAAPMGGGFRPQNGAARPGGGGGPRPAAQAKPNLPTYRALYPFDASEADELTIRPGDIITVVSQDNEGWWTGMINGPGGGRKGLFPSNYVEKV